jgi:hypothetical protein
MEASGEMVNQSFRTVLGALRPFTTASFAVVLIVIQWFIFINYSIFAEAGFSRDIAMIYMAIPVFLTVWLLVSKTKASNVIESLPVGRTIVLMVIGALATFIFVLPTFKYVLGIEFASTPKTEIMGVILMQTLFVAPSEELAFRSIIPRWLEGFMVGKWRFIGLFLAQVLFGFMHFAAYGGNYGSILIAIMVGCVWMSICRIKMFGSPIGIGFTMGSHMVYNLILMGVLSNNIGMVIGG